MDITKDPAAAIARIYLTIECLQALISAGHPLPRSVREHMCAAKTALDTAMSELEDHPDFDRVYRRGAGHSRETLGTVKQLAEMCRIVYEKYAAFSDDPSLDKPLNIDADEQPTHFVARELKQLYLRLRSIERHLATRIQLAIKE